MSSMTRPRICTNLLINAKLKFSTSSIRLKKSHYDTLGITSKATQNDIKSAYYKLTKVYHPDKNKSEEAKHKFRNITDAYEILGNHKFRKLYDRGMRPGPRHAGAQDAEEIKKEDAQTRFYKSRLHRSRVPAPGGRTPIYDFDEWTKAHYGDLLHQSARARENTINDEKWRENYELNMKNNKIWFPIVLIFLVITTSMFTAAVEDNYDKNKITSSDEESRPL